MIKHYIINRWY